jgi:hypothetical protein
LGPSFNIRLQLERYQNRQVRKVFHFCEPLTVTTGFISFIFDLRVVLKVA